MDGKQGGRADSGPALGWWKCRRYTYIAAVAEVGARGELHVTTATGNRITMATNPSVGQVKFVAVLWEGGKIAISIPKAQLLGGLCNGQMSFVLACGRTYRNLLM